MATTQSSGKGSPSFPQFYSMITRVMVLIAVIGLGIIYIGASQSLKYVTIAGFAFLVIGMLGAHYAIKNKKGMGFVNRL